MTDTSNDPESSLMEDIDPRYLEFIRNRVDSFIKWDLVRFFHDNPHTEDTATSIARYTGRDVTLIQMDLKDLAEKGVLEATPLRDMIVYTLTRDPEIRELIHSFVQACDNRQFRVKAIYHIISGMR